MGRPTFDQICHKVGRPRAGPLSKYVEFEKTKKWKFSQKETRNPNSDQYKFLRMILEHTEAFRFKFMSSSKNWIQVLKNHWAGPGPDLEFSIESLKSVINRIRNASVLSIIILEDLYRSEYFFLASLWLIFHFLFYESKVSRPSA